MSVLRLQNVVHAYGGAPTIRGVDLQVEAGEIVCLVGPSGCGKTTLLRLAAGLERLASGVIEVAGAVVADQRVHQPPEARDVGLVFQDYALFPHLDVASNVAFGLTHLPVAARSARVDETLRLVGLSSFGRRFPSSLSGGEQQRVALARALAPRPKALLMDEPFSGLDAATRYRVREETRAILRSNGTATLLVTHDGEEAMQLGNRIALMRKGELVQDGSGEELYFRPVDAFAASFFGEVNRLRASVAGAEVPTPLGPLPANGLADGTEAVVLLRHEALELCAQGPPATDARVDETRILGGHRLTTVTLADDTGITSRLQVRHDVAQRVEPGARVGLRLRPDLAHVFRADLEDPRRAD
ncbi:MAG: ABC transporter ATP-binding protein [Planctomycetota bacterium]